MTKLNEILIRVGGTPWIRLDCLEWLFGLIKFYWVFLAWSSYGCVGSYSEYAFSWKEGWPSAREDKKVGYWQGDMVDCSRIVRVLNDLIKLRELVRLGISRIQVLVLGLGIVFSKDTLNSLLWCLVDQMILGVAWEFRAASCTMLNYDIL